MRPAGGKPKRVIVVGAGIAGLTASFELMRAGHELTLLEARMRAGGRVHTLRESFADDLYAEAGAIDIGDRYELLTRYINLFNLPLVQPRVSPRTVTYARGHRFVTTDNQEPDWPQNLQPEERQLGRAGLWRKYVATAYSQIADPSAKDWPRPIEREFDSQTLNGLLLGRGLSGEAVSVIRCAVSGDDYDHVSALQSLMTESFIARNRKWMRIQGGNDRLPKAFAAKLGSRIRYGAEVVRLAQDGRKARISVLDAAGLQQAEADHVIVAVPFSGLRHCEMDDSVSHEKRGAIAKLRYESLTRVYLQSRTKFWREQGINGDSLTDLPFGVVLEHTACQGGRRGILEAQIEHEKAEQVWAMDPDQRVSWALKHMEKVHPELPANFEGGTSFSWDHDRFSLGSWAWYAPREMTTIFPHVAKPEGRIHFAGEHTSALMGTLEGAAESGVGAAGEVIAAES